jgi:MFS family permease
MTRGAPASTAGEETETVAASGDPRPTTAVANLPAGAGTAPATAPPRAAAAPAPGSRLRGGFRALGHRNYRLFWWGQLVSLVGTWVQQVAQGWLVLTLTNDPLALGITAACQFVPVTIFGLFGGVVADVLPKRTSLFATQTVALVQAAILAALVATGTVQVWHVWVLAAVLGVVNAIDMPVRQSFVMEMVGREDVANAVALNSAVFNGSRIVGPALAGLLIGTVGLAVCFVINAASYVAVLVSYVLMRPSELQKTATARVERTISGVFAQVGEGLRYVARTPRVLVPVALLGTVATFGMNFQVLMPVLARDVLLGDAGLFGLLMAASGLGSLAAAMSIAFGTRPTYRLLVVGAAVFGIALIAVSFSRSIPVSLVIMAVLGWGLIAMAATTNTLLQLSVPDELRGRVMSVYTTVFAGSTPIGGLFAGSIAAAAGAPIALLAGGVLSVGAAAVAATRLPALHRTVDTTRRPRT